jgi:hypothetical protein
MRDMYRRFDVAEGVFSRLSSIVRILLPNPPLSSDESYVEFYTVAIRMNNIDAGDEMEAPGCGRNSGEMLSPYGLQK